MTHESNNSDDPSGYFKSLANALEVKARTASLNDKITYAADIQSMLRQLLTEVMSSLLIFYPDFQSFISVLNALYGTHHYSSYCCRSCYCELSFS